MPGSKGASWGLKVAILLGSIAIAIFIALVFLQNGRRVELDGPATPMDASNAAAGICEQGVESVAGELGMASGAATDADVAWAFANEMYNGLSMREWRDAAFEGCLQGFRDIR